MAKKETKKLKDLDPKDGAKNVKGGGMSPVAKIVRVADRTIKGAGDTLRRK